jgi:hypothetical protein
MRSVVRVRDVLWLNRKMEYVTGNEFLFVRFGWVKNEKYLVYSTNFIDRTIIGLAWL